MIKLKQILLEQKSKEEILLDFLREQIKGTKFENNIYVAGGWIRDKIMGKKSKDVDITVALPDGGIEFAEWITKKIGAYRESTNPVIYPKFGTAKFNLRGATYMGEDLGNVDIESVMTRKEQYHEGDRKPDTHFGTPIQDVERRDLTINSLLYDISNQKVLDLTGKGLNDIKNKIIRTPLPADIIFKEDPLRMLRCIRFSVKLGWKLSNDILNSLTKNSKMLETISKERIQDELNKILLSDYPDEGIEYLVNTSLMDYIIPEYSKLIGLRQGPYHEFDVFRHSMEVLKKSPKRLEVRLAALLHDIGKISTKSSDDNIHFYGHEEQSAKLAEDILRNLKYSVNIIDRVSIIISQHMRLKGFGNTEILVSDKAFRKLMNDLGEHLDDLLDLIHADNCSKGGKDWKYNSELQVNMIRNKLKQIGDFTGKLNMPIDGNKIMSLLNLKPGKDVGIILNKFKDVFLEDPDKINNMSDIQIEKLIKKIYNNIKLCQI